MRLLKLKSSSQPYSKAEKSNVQQQQESVLFARDNVNAALVFFQPKGGYRVLCRDGRDFDAESLRDAAHVLVERNAEWFEVRFPDGGRAKYRSVDAALGGRPYAQSRGGHAAVESFPGQDKDEEGLL